MKRRQFAEEAKIEGAKKRQLEGEKALKQATEDAEERQREALELKREELSLQSDIVGLLLDAEDNTEGYLRALGKVLLRLRESREEGVGLASVFSNIGGGSGSGSRGTSLFGSIFGGLFGGGGSRGGGDTRLFAPTSGGNLIRSNMVGGSSTVIQNFRPNYVGNVTDSVRRTNAIDLRNQALAARTYLSEERL